ncbi:hypothetical protein ALC57_04277 [Trachymyrmex cornetzi]|uniref:Uncharacterized protein n=1 Tax=Trachymyrmex cornetzi TaxID=471704 RepID=A0A195EDX0_9HYME|nr:hypothetical protein ALC57_04277 [Trachymyrmex cornetzi]
MGKSEKLGKRPGERYSTLYREISIMRICNFNASPNPAKLPKRKPAASTLRANPEHRVLNRNCCGRVTLLAEFYPSFTLSRTVSSKGGTAAGSEEERWYLQFKRTSGNPTVRPSARGGPALERVGSSQSRGCKGKRGQSHGEHPAVQTPKCETWGQEESNRIMHRVFALRESLMITLESSC